MEKRTIIKGDIVTIEYPTVAGTIARVTFLIGDKLVPDRKPHPEYDMDHLWTLAVIGKEEGAIVSIPARDENILTATIVKVVASEPVAS